MGQSQNLNSSQDFMNAEDVEFGDPPEDVN